MNTLDYTFTIAAITLYAIIVLLALVYSLPILCMRRFQHRNNIFTVNVCLTTAFSCLLWLPNSIAPLLDESSDSMRKKWPWLYVLQMLSDISIPFSLVLVSFHRCCSIVYPHRRFFRRKLWLLICFGGQWIIGGLLSIPDFVYPRWVGLSVQ